MRTTSLSPRLTAFSDCSKKLTIPKKKSLQLKRAFIHITTIHGEKSTFFYRNILKRKISKNQNVVDVVKQRPLSEK